MTEKLFPLVYIGLLATTAGHIFTTQGAAHLSIQCKPQDCKIAEMVGNSELDGQNSETTI